MYKEIVGNREELKNSIEASEVRVFLENESLNNKVKQLEKENTELKNKVKILERDNIKNKLVIFGIERNSK